MKISIGTGNSNKVDGYEAGLEAASTVHEQLGADAPDFVFVFSTIGYEQEDILDAVADKFGDVPMSGATFEGIIGRGYADESMYAVQIVGLKSDDSLSPAIGGGCFLRALHHRLFREEKEPVPCV